MPTDFYDDSPYDDEEFNHANPDWDGRLEIDTPSGQKVSLTEAQAKFYVALRDKIMSEYVFTNVADLIALDRILLLELNIHDINITLTKNEDQNGRPMSAVDSRRLHQSVQQLTSELRKERDDLGLSRSVREADKGVTVGDYLENLRLRAKEFGVYRVKQSHAAIALAKEITSLVRSWLSADENERQKMGYPTAEDMLNHIAENLGRELTEIEEQFAQQQKYWITEVSGEKRI